MSDEQFIENIQIIHQQIAVLYAELMQSSASPSTRAAEAIEELVGTLGNLQLIYEEMLTSVEAAAVVQEELFQQNQQFIAERQYYQNLFQYCPEPYLVTDAHGFILEANQAIATLLNVPQNHLLRKPLANYIAQNECQAFCVFLNQLSCVSEVQNWQVSLCPKQGKPLAVKLKVAIAYDNSGDIKTLRIGVHDMSQSQQDVTQPTQWLKWEDFSVQVTTPPTLLPPDLDELQVLVVEDEADTREFVTTVLESHRIRVKAVTSAAEALKALEQFHPHVLVSDIRMPHEDGYSLIRKVRELEARKGWRIPAAALTAYLAEDREKALAAGFESYLHKLAQPAQLIEVVTQLAERASKSQS